MKILPVLSVLLVVSCDARPSATVGNTTESGTGIPPGAGFFDESTLLEGAVGLDDVACRGSGTTEIQGQVAAPFGRLAQNSVWDGLVPVAHAASLPDEQTIADAPVILGTTSTTWDIDKTLVSTRTDALGRFCIRIPAGYEPGPTLMLRAGTKPTLRRIVLDVRDGNVNLTSEAIVRLVQSSAAKPTAEVRNALFNLTTVSSTQVDLLAPVSLPAGSNVATALKQLDAQLRADPRVQDALAQLSRAIE